MDEGNWTENDRPYIEPPDEKDDDPHNGLYCFINSDRECGAACMAYTTIGAESPSLNDQQKNCAVLVALERSGRFSGVLVKMIGNFLSDNSRRNQPAPQKPLGG